jgi:hypothetical protein
MYRPSVRRFLVAAALALTGAAAVAVASPATAAPAPPTIPDTALLQAADLRGAEPHPVTDDYWSALRPPQPCGPYRSAGRSRADRAISAMVAVGDRPTVVMEHVAVYRPRDAHRYLRDLRRMARGCAEPGVRWTIRGTGLAGDESLLLRRREYVAFAGTYKSTYVAVARTGRTLVVVADAGWETGSGHETLVRKLAVRAVSRAAGR